MTQAHPTHTPSPVPRRNKPSPFSSSASGRNNSLLPLERGRPPGGAHAAIDSGAPILRNGKPEAEVCESMNRQTEEMLWCYGNRNHRGKSSRTELLKIKRILKYQHRATVTHCVLRSCPDQPALVHLSSRLSSCWGNVTQSQGKEAWRLFSDFTGKLT